MLTVSACVGKTKSAGSNLLDRLAGGVQPFAGCVLPTVICGGLGNMNSAGSNAFTVQWLWREASTSSILRAGHRGRGGEDEVDRDQMSLFSATGLGVNVDLPSLCYCHCLSVFENDGKNKICTDQMFSTASRNSAIFLFGVRCPGLAV